MVKNETEFRDLVASLLKKEGFSVQKEIKLPEGYRVDLLAEKDGVKKGIEVKLNQRGISDDISKGTQLHTMPEFDHIYIAAPKILISKEICRYANRVRIGIIGVEKDSIEWLVESQKLKPTQLLGGCSLPGHPKHPGSVFEVLKDVRNDGEKIVRHLEMSFTPSGPFVTAPKEKSLFKRKKLSPGEVWKENFKIKIKSSAKPGTYPLYLSCTADNVEPSESSFDINITSEKRE